MDRLDAIVEEHRALVAVRGLTDAMREVFAALTGAIQNTNTSHVASMAQVSGELRRMAEALDDLEARVDAAIRDQAQHVADEQPVLRAWRQSNDAEQAERATARAKVLAEAEAAEARRKAEADAAETRRRAEEKAAQDEARIAKLERGKRWDRFVGAAIGTVGPALLLLVERLLGGP